MHHRAIAKLYALVILSAGLVALSFHGLGIRPLEQHIRQTHAATLTADLEHARWQFDAIVDQHHDIARQAASRTAIRTAQVAYLEGRLSQAELTAFATPKLVDAMHANAHVLGIYRFAPDGTPLLEIGRPPAVVAVEACARHAGPDVLTLPARRGAYGLVFLHCSPIDDPAFGRAGFDLITLGDHQVRAFLAANVRPYRVHALAVEGGQLVLGPTAEVTARLRRTLSERGDEATGSPVESGLEIASTVTRVPGLGLHAIVDHEAYFLPIETMFRRLVAVLAGVGLAIVVLALWAVRPLAVALLNEEELKRRTRTDGLTGLANRDHVTRRIERAWQQQAVGGRAFAVIMVDIDHFKSVNDSHGHAAGDAALRSVARLCRAVAREADCWARFGGEEFLAWLPNIDAPGAAKVAERLRHVVEVTAIELPAGGCVRLTVSAGVAASSDTTGTEDLVAAADAALYASKRGGRNRVTVHRPKGAQPRLYPARASAALGS